MLFICYILYSFFYVRSKANSTVPFVTTRQESNQIQGRKHYFTLLVFAQHLFLDYMHEKHVEPNYFL